MRDCNVSEMSQLDNALKIKLVSLWDVGKACICIVNITTFECRVHKVKRFLLSKDDR